MLFQGFFRHLKRRGKSPSQPVRTRNRSRREGTSWIVSIPEMATRNCVELRWNILKSRNLSLNLFEPFELTQDVERTASRGKASGCKQRVMTKTPKVRKFTLTIIGNILNNIESYQHVLTILTFEEFIHLWLALIAQYRASYFQCQDAIKCYDNGSWNMNEENSWLAGAIQPRRSL